MVSGFFFCVRQLPQNVLFVNLRRKSFFTRLQASTQRFRRQILLRSKNSLFFSIRYRQEEHDDGFVCWKSSARTLL